MNEGILYKYKVEWTAIVVLKLTQSKQLSGWYVVSTFRLFIPCLLAKILYGDSWLFWLALITVWDLYIINLSTWNYKKYLQFITINLIHQDRVLLQLFIRFGFVWFDFGQFNVKTTVFQSNNMDQHWSSNNGIQLRLEP